MMLINSSDVERLVISPYGLIEVTCKKRPEEYAAVKPPIKVKLDKDMLVVIDLDGDELHGFSWNITALNSTKRKFNMTYVNEVFTKQFIYSSNSDIIEKRPA
jgi:hypothetical protein